MSAGLFRSSRRCRHGSGCASSSRISLACGIGCHCARHGRLLFRTIALFVADTDVLACWTMGLSLTAAPIHPVGFTPLPLSLLQASRFHVATAAIDLPLAGIQGFKPRTSACCGAGFTPLPVPRTSLGFSCPPGIDRPDLAADFAAAPLSLLPCRAGRAGASGYLDRPAARQTPLCRFIGCASP